MTSEQVALTEGIALSKEFINKLSGKLNIHDILN